MSDSATICGCIGVTKGTIIQAIHEKGVNTMSQLKECTRASTSCGSCTSLCQDLLRAVAPEFEEEHKKVICACLPFAEDKLRDILRSQRLKSVQEVLEIYGNGIGCEVCKPALSYMLDMLWCGDHDEDRSARFINDRVHANIQKDGTFSVIPRIRGGVTSPDELRRIADVADKYQVPMVKITGSQRIDLLGVKKADLPAVWADLGMPSGQAYTKGVRMVKTCVGTEFCRFGTQDSTGAGVEMERRFEQLFTPHKVKMATVGCPRNCAEATVKDIGLIGQENGWQVVVGGAAGKSVRKADLLITVETTEQALEASELFFQYYRENANYLERTYDFVERLGIEKVRKETVYAPEAVRTALLDRLAKSKARATRRVARGADAEDADAVHRRFGRWRRWTHERRTMDTRDGGGQHPAARGARGAGRRPRAGAVQSRRPLSRHRSAVPAPGRAAVRRHRHRHVGGVPAARLEDRSRERRGGAADARHVITVSAPIRPKSTTAW